VRIALAANRASGGGLDPEPLAAAIRAHGAEVAIFAPNELDRAATWGADRLAAASGDGTIGRVAELAGRLAAFSAAGEGMVLLLGPG
jgi:diacylglycerol kinase family enzyme